MMNFKLLLNFPSSSLGERFLVKRGPDAPPDSGNEGSREDAKSRRRDKIIVTSKDERFPKTPPELITVSEKTEAQLQKFGMRLRGGILSVDGIDSVKFDDNTKSISDSINARGEVVIKIENIVGPSDTMVIAENSIKYNGEEFKFEGKTIAEIRGEMRFNGKTVDITKLLEEGGRAKEYSFNLPGGQVILVTSSSSNPDEYYGSFKVFIGTPRKMREIGVIGVERYRDGGSTFIETTEGTLVSPTPFGERKKPTWNGKPIEINK